MFHNDNRIHLHQHFKPVFQTKLINLQKESRAEAAKFLMEQETLPGQMVQPVTTPIQDDLSLEYIPRKMIGNHDSHVSSIKLKERLKHEAKMN